MPPSPALALIRLRQLLSALFTIHFHVHALQIIIPKIGHSATAQVQLANCLQYSRLFLPPRSIPSIALISVNKKSALGRVAWGKMSAQSKSLEIFIFMPKLRERMVIRSTLLFSHCRHWDRKKLMTLLS